MVIVVEFGSDVHHYVSQFPALPFPVPKTCPLCAASGCLNRHGNYFRRVCDQTQAVPIPVRRLLCSSCRHTISLLPSFCLPHRHYGTSAVQTVLGWRLGALASWRRIGQHLLPADLPTVTTCRQWVKAFTDASGRYLGHLLRQLSHWQLAPGKLELALDDIAGFSRPPQQLLAAVPHLVAWLRDQGLAVAEGHVRWLATLSLWGNVAKLGRLV